MKRIVTMAALVVLLSAPAHAGYRRDCASVGSWFGHVRVAFARLLGATFSASLPDLTKMAIDGSLNTEDGAGAAVTLLGQTVAAHINPLAAFDMGAALVCFPSDSDNVNP
jgi:hypothetical protein